MSFAEAIWRSSDMVNDDQGKDKQHGEGAGRGKSNHAGDMIGNFKADMMAACITEINYWESKAKSEGKDKPDKENSRNKIFKQHGLSPSTLSKWITGKVQGLPSIFAVSLLSYLEELPL